jgi:hypothetical protein
LIISGRFLILLTNKSSVAPKQDKNCNSMMILQEKRAEKSITENLVLPFYFHPTTGCSTPGMSTAPKISMTVVSPESKERESDHVMY